MFRVFHVVRCLRPGSFAGRGAHGGGVRRGAGGFVTWGCVRGRISVVRQRPVRGSSVPAQLACGRRRLRRRTAMTLPANATATNPEAPSCRGVEDEGDGVEAE